GPAAAALSRIGAQVIEAVRTGMAADPLGRPRPAGNNGRWRHGGPPSPEIEERYERLRVWRKGRAEARKVEVQVIAPNAVLWAIARANPGDVSELSAVGGMGSFREGRVGEGSV